MFKIMQNGENYETRRRTTRRKYRDVEARAA